MDNDLNTSLKQPNNSPLHCWIRAQFIVIEAGKLSLFFCVSVDKISYVEMLKRYTFMEVEELSLCYIYRSNQLNIEQFTLKKNHVFFSITTLQNFDLKLHSNLPCHDSPLYSTQYLFLLFLFIYFFTASTSADSSISNIHKGMHYVECFNSYVFTVT